MDKLTKENITVVLADDHSIVRDGVKSILEDVQDINVIGEAADGEEALEVVQNLSPDILIVDIRMPKLNGIDTVFKLSQRKSLTKTLVLSMHDSEDYVLKSVEAGANGYLLKDVGKEEFIKAIYAIYNGGKYFSGELSPVFVNKYLENINNQPLKKSVLKDETSNQPIEHDFKLTKRQKEILGLAVKGMSNKEIADYLGKSIRTVEAHRFSMMKKLQVKNLMELSNKAKELGIV